MTVTLREDGACSALVLIVYSDLYYNDILLIRHVQFIFATMRYKSIISVDWCR